MVWRQDTRSLGVGNAYTATLPSTRAILKAVRAARAWQQGIRAQRQPCRLWADPLPQTTPNSCQDVMSLHLSPDSVHCVVDYTQSPLQAETGMAYHMSSSSHSLALYKTHRGKLNGVLRPWNPISRKKVLIRWSPCSKQLMVCGGEDRPIDLYDIATGTSLTLPWMPAYLPRMWHRDVFLNLSPDGTTMLAIRSEEDSAAGIALCLDVLRMPDSSLVASFELSHHADSSRIHDRGCSANWLWHPSSKGLIIASCKWGLISAAPLQAAGLSVGYCPLPAHPSEDSFSPSGRMLLAPSRMDISHTHTRRWLSCSANKTG